MPNNFSNDSRIYGVYNLDSNGQDSSGKGNHMTADVYQAYDASNKKQGTHSGYVTQAGGYQYRLDADLSAGFPLKGGDTDNRGMWMFWLYVSSLAVAQCPVGKWRTNVAQYRKLQIRVATNGWVGVDIGYGATGGSVETWSPFQLQTGRWYHIAIGFNGSTKAYMARVWDDTAQEIIYDDTHTATNTMYSGVNQQPFSIVAGWPTLGLTGGRLDELVVVDDWFTDVEIDAIRNGEFPPLYKSPLPTFFRP